MGAVAKALLREFGIMVGGVVREVGGVVALLPELSYPEIWGKRRAVASVLLRRCGRTGDDTAD